ncbi:MAG: hypothetical protein QOH39_3177 [Verrucomicrobiota bacterium]|jgi:hypothetical protein
MVAGGPAADAQRRESKRMIRPNEESFTLRRKDAKRRSTSKDRGLSGSRTRSAISFPNLSALASLRETSGCSLGL